MPDLTELVLTCSFSAGLGIFAAAALGRKLLSPGRSTPPETLPAPDEDVFRPFQSPARVPSPPPLLGRVPTWFYRPLDLVGLGAIYVAFFALVISSVRSSQKADLAADPKGLLISIAFQFFMAGSVIAIMTPRVRLMDWLGLRWSKWPWVFLIAPGVVTLMWVLFGSLQAAGYMEWMESLGVESVQESVKLLQDSTDPVVLGLMSFAAVFAAPFCEEIVFRGYFYPAAKKFAGPWAAGIFSALVFASAHGNLSALLPLFIFGCVLVFVYEKTGSLWAPIAIHFCFNGATVLVQMASRFLNHLPTDSLQ